MMSWSTLFVCCITILSANAFSKYGRSCKDIGCLNSEVCVMAEDPCSYGHTSDCGNYPTCKKKTAADGETHNVPVTRPTTPRPIADIRPAQPAPPRYDDNAPNYPPPPPPRGSSFGTNTGGSSSNNGGGGFFNSGGTNGGSSGGFTNPFSNFGFGSGFGSNTGGGSSSGGSGSNPLTSIFSNIFSNLTKGGLLPALNPSFTRPGLIENKNTNPNPYPYPNTNGGQNYPAYPNGGSNYPAYPSNGQNYPAYPSNGQNYPAYPANGGQNYPGYSTNQRQGGFQYSQPGQTNSQGQPTQQNGYVARNYGQSHAGGSVRNMATTTSRPFSWLFGLSVFTILFTQIFIKNR